MISDRHVSFDTTVTIFEGNFMIKGLKPVVTYDYVDHFIGDVR